MAKSFRYADICILVKICEHMAASKSKTPPKSPSYRASAKRDRAG